MFAVAAAAIAWIRSINAFVLIPLQALEELVGLLDVLVESAVGVRLDQAQHAEAGLVVAIQRLGMVDPASWLDESQHILQPSSHTGVAGRRAILHQCGQAERGNRRPIGRTPRTIARLRRLQVLNRLGSHLVQLG